MTRLGKFTRKVISVVMAWLLLFGSIEFGDPSLAFVKADAQAALTITNLPATIDLKVGENTIISPSLSDQSIDGIFDFTTSNAELSITDNNDGTATVTALSEGNNFTVTVGFTPNAAQVGVASPSTVDVTINVTKYDVSISTTPITVTYGQSLDLSTAIDYHGGDSSEIAIALSSSDTEVISVDNNIASINKASATPVTITVTLSVIDPADAGKYNLPAATPIDVTVNKANRQALEFDDTSAQIDRTFDIDNAENNKFTNAIKTPIVSNGETGDIVYSITPNGVNVAEIASDGEVTYYVAGTYTVQATRPEDDCYNAATPVSYTLAVAKADPSSLSFTGLPQNNTYTYDPNTNSIAVTLDGTDADKYDTPIVTLNDPTSEYVSVSGNVITVTKVGGSASISITANPNSAYADKLNAYTQSDITLILAKADQSGISFEKSGSDLQIVFNPQDMTFTNTASGGDGTGSFTYQIVAAETTSAGATVDADGVVHYLEPGTIKVQAVKVGDDNYNAILTPIDYELVIGKIVEDIHLTNLPANNTCTYGDTPISVGFEITGDDGTVANKFDAPVVVVANGGTSDVVEISGNTITILKSGTVDLSISVSPKTENEAFYDSYATDITLTVEKKNQAALSFGSAATTLYYQNGLTQSLSTDYAVTGGNDDIADAVEYSIETGADVASISGDVLTISKAGTFTLKAIKNPNSDNADKYNPVEETITVTVNKGSQVLSFAETNPSIIYGNNTNYSLGAGSYSQAASIVNETTNSAVGTSIVYSIKNGSNNSGVAASIDSSTGALTLVDGKVGSIIVVANKAGDDNFDAATAVEYTLTVEEATTPATPYVLGGIKIGNWFSTDVAIQAPTGYKVSLNNSVATDGWLDSIDVNNAEGVISGKKIYLREIATGNITGLVDVEDFNIDKTAPSNLSIVTGSAINTIANVLFFRDQVNVTLKATDTYSGIKSFTYYTSPEDTTGTTVNYAADSQSWSYNDSTKEYTYNFVINAQNRGTLRFDAADNVDKVTSIQAGSDISYVVDSISPEVTIKYPAPSKVANNKWYFNADTTYEFEVVEDNFYPADIQILDGATNIADGVTWVNTPGTNIYTYSYTFTTEGEHVLSVSYSDNSGNASNVNYSGNQATSTNTLVIDKTAPVVNVSFNDAAVPVQSTGNGIKYYAGAKQMTVTVTETNFTASSVNLTVNGVSATAKSTLEAALINATWAESGNVHTASITFADDADYTISLAVTDIAENAAVEYTLNDSAEVATSFADYKFTVDTVAPVQPTVDYTADYSAANALVDSSNSIVASADATTRFIYNNTATLKMKLTEKHFDPANAVVNVYKNGSATPIVPGTEYQYNAATAWTSSEDTHTLTLNIGSASGTDGDYVVEVTYADPAGNSLTITSNEITIDNTLPVIEVTYPADGSDVVILNGVKYFASARSSRISITDKNFGLRDLDVSAITVKDIEGNDVQGASGAYAAELIAFISDLSNWNVSAANLDVHYVDISYTEDGIYTFSISYSDLASNAATAYTTETFAITAEKPSNLSVTYGTSERKSTWQTILNAITTIFHAYKNTTGNITLTAKSSFAPIDKFVWFYVPEGQSVAADPFNESGTFTVGGTISYTAVNSPITVAADGTATATISLTDEQANQYRGHIFFYAVNRSGVRSDLCEDSNQVVIVDSIAPGRTVTYGTPDRVVNSSNIDVASFDTTSENASVKLYYKDSASLTVAITEANFYEDDAVIKYSVDGGADVTYENPVWTAGVNNVYSTTLTFTEAGEYVVKVTYTDRSSNAMTNYTSDVVVIDKAVPSVNVAYSGTYNTVTGDASKYYSADSTVTVTIDEKNFRASDVVVTVSAKDVNGTEISSSVAGKTYAQVITEYFASSANWQKAGTVNTATFTLDQNADYTFSIEYTDLATRAAVYGANSAATYTQDVFTIDKVAAQRVVPSVYTNSYSLGWKRLVNAANETVAAANADATTRFIYDRSATYTFVMTEDNFDEADAVITVTKDGSVVAPANYTATWTSNSNTRTLEVVLAENNADSSKDGDYTVAVSYQDRAGNTALEYTSNVITIDTTAPSLTVSYSDADTNGASHDKYYSGDRVATLTLTDRNITPNDIADVCVTVTAVDVLGADVASAAHYSVATQPTWTNSQTDSNVWTATINYNVDANYTFQVDYKDMADHAVAGTTNREEFTVDKVAPSGISVEYGKYAESDTFLQKVIGAVTFGYYKPQVKVTITASDATSPIDYFTWSYVQEDGTSSVNTVRAEQTNRQTAASDQTVVAGTYNTSATFKMTADEARQFRGRISFTATDYAANTTTTAFVDETKEIVVDTIIPTWAVSEDYSVRYSGNYRRVVNDINGVKTPLESVNANIVGENTKFIFSGEATLNWTLNEANFYEEDVKIVVTRNGETVRTAEDTATSGDGYTFTWSDGVAEDSHVLTMRLGKNGDTFVDGDYQVAITYTDRSGNQMVSYTSDVLVVDTTAPVITVVYDNNTFANEKYYNADRTATLTVVDKYIDPSEGTVTITAVDVTGAAVTATGIDTVKAQPTWTQDSTDPTKWTATINYNVDAQYSFEINLSDYATNAKQGFTVNPVAGQAKAEVVKDEFVVDKVSPSTDDITINYTAPVTSILKQIVKAITFNYYRTSGDEAGELKVTVSAKDDISGIDYLTCSYDVETVSGADTTGDAVPSTVVNTYEVVLNPSDADISEDGDMVTMSFALPAAADEQFRYRGNVSVVATDKAANDSDVKKDDGTVLVVDSVSPTCEVVYSPIARRTASEAETETNINSYRIYSSENVTATIRITEDNFYPEDVVIKLDGSVVYGKDAGTFVNGLSSNWTQSNNVWTAQYVIVAEGDHKLTMDYTDKSENAMTYSEAGVTTTALNTYESGVITIDKTNPVISVGYSGDFVQTLDGIEYYSTDVVVNISIVERNFNPGDVNVTISAANAANAGVGIPGYAEIAKTGAWSKSGDTNTFALRLSTDGIYTVSVDYSDMAGRGATPYSVHKIAVDKTAPTDLRVEYSTPVYETILQAITFGFYNAHATVTIFATDAATGIHRFEYSYVKSEGVSGVNTELVNEVIDEAGISYSNGKMNASASFRIPNAELRNDRQFNGTVNFVAYDRALRSTDFADTKRIVVDNLSPIAEVQVTEPVNIENGVHYYDGGIDYVITVTEANFDSEDVKASVTYNGTTSAANIAWSNEGTDRHIGRISFTEDGTYSFVMSYADRATNAMNDYRSEQMIIDTKAPSVVLSGIKDKTANKDNVVGFVITVEDDNLSEDDFKPVLIAQMRDADGKIVKKNITSDGNVSVVTNGKSYTYTVTNLSSDGIYDLSCVVTDRALNQTTGFVVADSNNAEAEDVKFTVNRVGSAYGYGNKATEELNGTYTKEAGNVVITEINADELSNIKITLFKDGKAVVLEKDKDYSIAINNDNEDWYEYTYTIFKENFESDGIYSIELYSEDAAGNEASNTIESKEVKVQFIVDNESPILNVTTIENGETYLTEELNVIFKVTDNIEVDADSIAVVAELRDGSTSEFSMENGKIVASDIKGEYSFVITEGTYRSIKFTALDKAENEVTEEVTDITVTTSKVKQTVNTITRPIKNFFQTIANFFKNLFRRKK